MRQLQKVLWSKGVLLTPQHLQIQDRYVEDFVGFQFGALSATPWGFSALAIDRERLEEGALAVSQARGILPDGLMFDIPDADVAPEPRPLEACWKPDQQSLDIYLAIPEYQPNAQNLALEEANGSTRFSALEVRRRDENTGLGEKPILLARKNLRIAVEGDSLKGSALLPMARVLKRDDTTYELDAGFIPPVLNIAASQRLMTLGEGLVERLTAKSAELSSVRRERGRGLADFGLQDVPNFWLLHTSNSFLPRMRHLLQVKRGHPAELFHAMLTLAGALTTFSEDVAPVDLPRYDHQHLTECFGELDETVRRLLATVVPKRSLALPLNPISSTVHSLTLDDKSHLSAPQLFLAISSDLDEGELQDRVITRLKVGAPERVDFISAQGMAGIVLSHLATRPSAIRVKTGYEYFALDRSGSEWKEVLRAGQLAAYVPSSIPGARLELVVVLPGD